MEAKVKAGDILSPAFLLVLEMASAIQFLSMNDRKITLSAIFVISVIVLATTYILLERSRILAQQKTRDELWVGTLFQKIESVRGKALLIPAPVDQRFSVPRKLYVTSDRIKNYWAKPRFVDVGFEFEFFDGAKFYNYKIVDFQPSGINLQYNHSASPPRSAHGMPPIVLLHWKR